MEVCRTMGAQAGLAVVLPDLPKVDSWVGLGVGLKYLFYQELGPENGCWWPEEQMPDAGGR
jgi:hypothetical protein